jgi:hypothetical protein
MNDLSQSRHLNEPIINAGIRNTNFFNGRILTASDLQTDQDANRRQHAQLAEALGGGIANGLEVGLLADGADGKPPVVSVTRGLAFSQNGQAIALPLDVQVALARQITSPPAEAGLFADCGPPSSTVVPVQAGIYVLLATPASGYSDRAPMVSFGGTGVADQCGARFAVEGVRFRLELLDTAKLTGLSQATRNAIAALMTKTDAANLSLLRNWIAHICFGTEEVEAFARDPFARTREALPLGGFRDRSALASYGAVDALRAAGTLTACDVPLALLFWTLQGVRFLDMWSVRRLLIAESLSAQWPLPFGARRRAESEAVFFQFQGQISTMVESNVSQATLFTVAAKDHFRYLPAVGLLPLAGAQSSKGFSYVQFFSDRTCRGPIFIRDAKLEPLLRRSLAYPPIDLSSQELIWLYLLPGNSKLANQPAGAVPALIFAHAHVSYQGDSRYDASQWDFSNYSLTDDAVVAS